MTAPTTLPAHARFPPRGDSVAAARRFIRGALAERGLTELIDDAALLVSELATNAVVHAGTAFEVTCVDVGSGVRIEVHDKHPARELPTAPPGDGGAGRERGRGLLVCAALAQAWGVEYSQTGKTVWCRLDRPESADTSAEDTRARSQRAPARDGVRVGVISTDADDRVRAWNPDMEDILGWPADQVVDRPLAVLRDHTADVDAQNATPGRWEGELDLRHQDGRFIRVFVSRQHRTGDAGASLWLVVPAEYRDVLEHPSARDGHDDQRGSGSWAVFSRAEISQLSLDELLRRAVQRACDALDGDAAYVLLVDEDAGDPWLAASTGLPPTTSSTAAAEAIAGRMGRDRLPAVYEDLLDDRALPVLAGTTMRSAVSVPLVVEGRVIGQLVVASTTPGAYGNHDAIAMSRAGDHLSLSIESCRIGELARRHRGWLGYLADASDLLAGTLDPTMTLAMLAQLMVPRLATWCAAGTRDERGLFTLNHVWHADETRIDALRGRLAPDFADLVATEEVRVPGLDDVTLRLPLRARGHELGVVVIGRPAGQRFDTDVVELAYELSRRAALTLDNALLFRRQVETSRAFQRSLLPRSLPDIPGVEIGVAFQAAGEGQDVGGDFYDLFAIGPNRWRFAIGDVCGSGAEAAAITGLARHVLRTLGNQGQPIPDALARLNQAIRQEFGSSRFLTVLHGEIEPGADGVSIRMVAAGHPLPYLLDPPDRYQPVGTNQSLLGVVDEVAYTEDVVTLAGQRSLLCVTDGVTERRNGHRMLGEDDLGELLAACAGVSASAAATAVQRAVDEYAPIPPSDDLAVLVLRAI